MQNLELPTKVRATIPGFEPVYFYMSDFTSYKAWERLCKGSPNLRSKDFKDILQYRRYYLIAADLLEGTVVVSGREGSGKSQFAYYLAQQRRDLFGIPPVFNRKAKKPFGEYWDNVLPDDEFKAELDKYNQIVKEIEALKIDADSPLPDELQARVKALKFYGCTKVIDEAYKEVAKDHITNRTRMHAQLVRQYRHLHTLFIFMSPDQKDVANRLIFERRTHQVMCRFDHGICKYVIFTNSPKVRGHVSHMEIDPRLHGNIFDSWNLTGVETLKIYN